MTAKTESVQYSHPNHTVTVTTISDLDLSGARLLGLPLPEVGPGPSPGKEGAQEQTGLLGVLSAGSCDRSSSARGSFPSGPMGTAEVTMEHP